MLLAILKSLLKKGTRVLILLEIGVFRGQIITLWALNGRALDLKMNVLALSPFEPAGDSVSKYDNILYYEDVVSNTRSFNVEVSISIFKAYPNSIEGKKAITSSLSCIYRWVSRLPDRKR